MGYGDDLMITAFARKLKETYPDRQIVIGNKDLKKAYDSDIFLNNPYITHSANIDKTKPIHLINYHNFNRPYIDYKNSSTNIVWNRNFSPVPGEIYFNHKEEKKAEIIFKEAILYWEKNKSKKNKGVIFLENFSTKINTALKIRHINKNWGFENWNNLINILKEDYLLIQSKHKETKKIDGVFLSKDEFNFREACAIIKKCDLFLGNEGGFSHASAALNKKAVVYFGGWIHPKTTGYEFHNNIFVDIKGSPCGAKLNICDHCNKCREIVTPDMIHQAIIKEIG